MIIKHRAVFRNTVFEFPDDILRDIFRHILLNENLDENDKQYVLSFKKNQIIRMYWDDIDYGEFVLNPSYRISNLLCNIYNHFGQGYAKKFASVLSDKLQQNFEWFSTDWFDAVSASTINSIAKDIFKDDSKLLDKFQILLTLLYLYDISVEDYEQQVTDPDDYFDKIRFVNGVGFRKIQQGNKYMLLPINDYYVDQTESSYKEFNGYLVPKYLRAAVFKSSQDIYFTEEDRLEESDALFFLKFEQLTGGKLENLNVSSSF